MTFIVDEKNGNIKTVQGDSGTLVVKGINTDKDYSVYFSIFNERRKIIGNEIEVQSNYKDVVIFEIPSNLTNLLAVNINDETAEYYYGIKICYKPTNYEDTVVIKGKNLGELNIITVYPKQVEGLIS